MVLAIGFMYLCAFLLLPLMGFAMWCAFSGDKMREQQEAAQEALQDAAQVMPLQSASSIAPATPASATVRSA
jgi:hypothetical protein